MTRGGAGPLLAFLVAGVAGCGSQAPSVQVQSIEDFSFVRDDAEILSAGQRRQAEERLREIAQETGVFGVVVTAGANESIDPPSVYAPVIDEVRAIGGEALVTICTRDLCGPTAGAAHTEALYDAVARVGSEEPPPGEGRGNLNRGLRAWLDYVAAVAAAYR